MVEKTKRFISNLTDLIVFLVIASIAFGALYLFIGTEAGRNVVSIIGYVLVIPTIIFGGIKVFQAITGKIDEWLEKRKTEKGDSEEEEEDEDIDEDNEEENDDEDVPYPFADDEPPVEEPKPGKMSRTRKPKAEKVDEASAVETPSEEDKAEAVSSEEETKPARRSRTRKPKAEKVDEAAAVETPSEEDKAEAVPSEEAPAEEVKPARPRTRRSSRKP